MRNTSKRRYEPRSPYSGTTALVEGQHTSGRRDFSRFTDDAKLVGVLQHRDQLAKDMRRAIRKGRPEKQMKLMAMMHQANDTAALLQVRIHERNMGNAEPSHNGSRVLLDLSNVNHYSWGPQRERWSPEIVNHGRVFKFKSE